MDAAGATRPAADDEAEVTPSGRPFSVSTRVERADAGTLVVRPSTSDFVEQEVVRVGDQVQVFWRDSASGWGMPAVVSTVERGAVPRWHLAVAGPAEPAQRREAVRVRLALPITAEINGVDLAGEALDISEGGVRAVMDAFGNPPMPGTVVPLTLHLEDGAVAGPAEVVRHQTRGTRWGVSLHFVDLPEKEQDRLRRRIFRAMREERARASD